MQKIPVIAIFDVGKTNKKLFLFNQHYQIVYEKAARFTETNDEDGFPCDNVDSLRLSVFDSLNEVLKLDAFDIIAINFTTYGASLVYVDENGKPLTPLYNYLKPYPESLSKHLYKKYNGEENICLQTASPSSGSLNSGLQLYRIKTEKPALFENIKYALHLPQFMSSLITGKFYSDITSIGCHTHLWDFQKNDYHQWVYEEGLHQKLAPIFPSNQVIQTQFMGKEYLAGVGLHDSSAALIPYLVNFSEPFILISTGTWCISLNPFNKAPLTKEEINCNCLCYLSYQGTPVKASRLFAGYEHEQQTKRIAEHFQVPVSTFRTMNFRPETIALLKEKKLLDAPLKPACSAEFISKFNQRDLTVFDNVKEAYHQLIMDIMEQQFLSTNMVLQKGVTKKIFVDGGFSKNNIYMNLLAIAFPDVEVYAASMAQATALGTAIALHTHWNKHPLPNDIIDLKFFASLQKF
ncbi:MAG TPA: FGGY family carbohydrate kinase [Arachidicoccus soli]|uniref:Carbohydrate kinase n=1 Tax=Arachidicoccus soli TaxID=2341117 RepID=A0A386HPQ9_9BACT|nr:FGGY family carbohydrate kinase [Arachidicoccus soli]AYD47639.1 carbohydrate kinase [Arachidicoccus soli]HEU0227071.1 FGGY family carbohydrate kinase [Arachidicoccus soli]